MGRAAEVDDRHPEAVRKLLHLSVSVVPVLYANGVGRELLLVVLGAASAAALIVELARRSLPGARDAFERTVGTFLRDRERRGLTGATWLCIAGFVATLLLDRRPAIAALWCAAVGDPAATIIGRDLLRLNARPKSPGKTFAGSGACFVASFLGVWLAARFDPLSAVMVAITATLAERFAGRFDDNLTVMAVTGGLATFLT